MRKRHYKKKDKKKMSNSEWKEFKKKIIEYDNSVIRKPVEKVWYGNKKFIRYRDIESGNEFYEYSKRNKITNDDDYYYNYETNYYFRPEQLEKYLKKSKRVPTEKYSKKFKSKNQKPIGWY